VEQMMKRRYYVNLLIIKKPLRENMPLKKQLKSISLKYNTIQRFDSGKYDIS